MRDLLPQLNNWLSSGQPFALATVISTWGSTPRPLGSYMAIRQDAAFIGSVSGGCVEGAVIEEARKVIESGQPQLLHFGVSDETAWDVGLACGGEIDIYLQPADIPLLQELISLLEAQKAVAHAFSLVTEQPTQQILVKPESRETENPLAAQADLAQRLQAERPLPELIPQKDGQRLFFNPLLPSPKLIIIGGVHITQALIPLARQLHYQVFIIDPRKTFLHTERFPDASAISRAWPKQALQEIGLDRQSALVSLSHDPKIDDPALQAALESDAFYIGALGSRKTHAQRLARLQESGFTSQQLARIHSPIGLDIGADTPEEIALAIMAQVIQVSRA